MNAQQKNAPNDRWFLVDVAHASYNVLRNACRDKHAESRRAGLLSIYINNAGTEAIIKVADAGAWTPPPGRLIATYTPDTLAQLQALVRTPEWARPMQ